jgi:hypothetical protein
MSPDALHWTDHTGVSHQLRVAQALSPAERDQLDILRQQVRYTAHLLDSGFNMPVVAEAPPNMVRMMLRILLPNVAKEEIATFDPVEGQDLLTTWWAMTDRGA